MHNVSDSYEDEVLEMRSDSADESSLARKVVLFGFVGLMGLCLALGFFVAIVSFAPHVPFIR